MASSTEYLVCDFGSSLSLDDLRVATDYEIAGFDSQTGPCYIRIGNAVFRGSRDSLVGTNLIFGPGSGAQREQQVRLAPPAQSICSPDSDSDEQPRDAPVDGTSASGSEQPRPLALLGANSDIVRFRRLLPSTRREAQ